MSTPSDIFTERAISTAVRDARGYVQYAPGDVETILDADDRLRGTYVKDGETKRFEHWVRKYAASGGWVMKKHRVLGSTFPLDPLPQLRPDVAVPGRTVGHDHDGMIHVERNCPCGVASHKRREGVDKKGRPWVTIGGWVDGVQLPLGRHTHARHVAGSKHGGVDVAGPHKHVEDAKYAFAPGPHGKRWDTNPLCDEDAFMRSSRVFLHLEGCLKLDSLVSAGEVGIDVPSVTLWNRGEDDISSADYPDGEDDFWDFWRPTAQTLELTAFLDVYGGAPVIVACDADWFAKPGVAVEAFSLRDVVRDRGFDCIVAAPPIDSGTKGSDDYFYAGGTPDTLATIEPVEPPALVAFALRYGRRGVGASGRRSPAETVNLDIEVLRWLATHSTVEGYVKRPAATIARRLGVSDDAVYKAVGRLIDARAVEDDDAPLTPIVDKRLIRDDRGRLRDLGRGHKGETPTLRLREDLRAELLSSTVGDWSAACGDRHDSRRA